MLVSCIAFTNDCSNDQILLSIESFEKQLYPVKQLIIINNYNSLEDCLKLEIVYNKEICILDRPKFSNAKALIEAAEASKGQIIVHFPLEYYYNKNYISTLVQNIIEYQADLVSPCGYSIIEHNHIHDYVHPKNIVAELSGYKRPAFRSELDIDYGSWWQYPLFLYEHGNDIISIDNTKLALKIPYVYSNKQLDLIAEFENDKI